MKKNEVPYGSDVSGGTFACVNCGQTITMASGDSLPPCPRHDDEPHPSRAWRVHSGRGDARNDPYPDRRST